jgi:hypothetical protein
MSIRTVVETPLLKLIRISQKSALRLNCLSITPSFDPGPTSGAGAGRLRTGI